MTMRMNRTDKLLLVFSYVVLAGLLIIPSLRMHAAYTVDEFGTFANSAYLAGYDWTEAVHAAGDFYYKYGTVVFYGLPFLLIRDSLVLYRVLLVIGGLLLGFSGPAAYMICRKFLHVEKPWDAFGLTMVSTTAPAILFQSSFGRADWLLVMLSWVLILLLLELAEAGNGKKRAVLSILAALGSVFAYMCHTRGIVLVLAVLCTAACGSLFFHVRTVHYPVYFLALAGSLGADRFLTGIFKNAIWGKYGAGHASSGAFSLSAVLKSVFTAKGLAVLVKGSIGWLFSLFTSTAGLVAAGFLTGCFILIRELRRRNSFGKEEILAALFGLFNFLGSFALGILFFFPHIVRNYSGTVSKNVQRLLYERYMIGSVGILCLLALVFFIFRRKCFGRLTGILSLAAFAGVIFLANRSTLPLFDTQAFDRKMVAATGVLLRRITPNSRAFLAAGLLALGVFCLLLLLFRIRRGRIAMILVCALFVGVYLYNYEIVRVKKDTSTYKPMKAAVECLISAKAAAAEYPYVYLIKSADYPKIYQPVLKEYRIIDKKYKEAGKLENLWLVTKGEVQNRASWAGPIYRLNHMKYGKNRVSVYVMGEGLKDRLESMGYALSEYVTE